MKKHIYLIILITIVLGGYLGYLLLKKFNKLPITNTFLITTGGNKILVRDFYKNPVMIFGENDVVVRETPDYRILYFAKDQGFLISILRQPVKTAREKAEKDFLEALNIQKGEACKLEVSLAVAKDVDFDLAGGNYHLSFCPNGRAF